jgi:hypothetical protein
MNSVGFADASSPPAAPHRSDHCIDALLRLRLLVFMQFELFEHKSLSNIHPGHPPSHNPAAFGRR